MYITSKYLGTTLGKFKYLFFWLLEDYVEAQSSFVHEIDGELERFARNLGESGAVVKPFLADIESVKGDILRKHWPRDAHEILLTPGMLMIDVDFDVFDPTKHPWIYFHFGQRIATDSGATTQSDRIAKVRELLTELTRVILETHEDVFGEANKLNHSLTTKDVVSVFEAKPGIFGFSIDLVRGASVVRTLFKRNQDSRGSRG